jgi:hypothetical protein
MRQDGADFKHFNKQFETLETDDPEEYKRLVEVGAAAQRAFREGLQPFAQRGKRTLTRLQRQKWPNELPAAAQQNAEEPEIIEYSREELHMAGMLADSKPGNKVPFDPSWTSADVVRVYRQTRRDIAEAARHDAKALVSWQQGATAEMHKSLVPYDEELGVAQPLPTFPNVAYVKWPAPARAIVQRALSAGGVQAQAQQEGEGPQTKAARKKKHLEDDAYRPQREAMLKLWRSRHQPVLHKTLPQLQKAITRKKTLCHSVGFCVCKNKELQNLAHGFKTMLRRFLKKGTRARLAYNRGHLVLRLKAPSSDGSWLHLSYGNLREYEFTFLELYADSCPIRIREARAVHATPLTTTCQVRRHRMWRFLAGCDVSLEYDCRLFRLICDGTRVSAFSPGTQLLVESMGLSDKFTQKMKHVRKGAHLNVPLSSYLIVCLFMFSQQFLAPAIIFE